MGTQPSSPPTDNVITVTSPAAGANWLYTVPPQTSIRLLAVHFSLDCDANPADRNAEVTIDDASNVYYFSVSSDKLTANNIYLVCFAPGHIIVAAGSAHDNTVPLAHNLIIPGGHVIRSRILNIQAGDQLAGIRILTERYVA